MFSGIVWRIYVGFVAHIDIKILEVPPPPPGLGMPFLDSNTCVKGGCYLFLPGFSCCMEAIHGRMIGRMDGWTGHVKNFTKNDHDILYVIIVIPTGYQAKKKFK